MTDDKDPGQLLIDFCDRMGLDAEDFSEVLDKALFVAENADIKLQRMTERIARGQSHNADAIRVLGAAFAAQWALIDAAFDWGWDVDEELEPADIVGAMLIAGIDIMHKHRVTPKEDENGR